MPYNHSFTLSEKWNINPFIHFSGLNKDALTSLYPATSPSLFYNVRNPKELPGTMRYDRQGFFPAGYAQNIFSWSRQWAFWSMPEPPSVLSTSAPLHWKELLHHVPKGELRNHLKPSHMCLWSHSFSHLKHRWHLCMYVDCQSYVLTRTTDPTLLW